MMVCIRRFVAVVCLLALLAVPATAFAGDNGEPRSQARNGTCECPGCDMNRHGNGWNW